MNFVEKKILAGLPEDLKEITPGLVVDVHVRGRRAALLEVGQVYAYYDLASLTKILFTASRAMMLISSEPNRLKEDLRNVLPWWRNPSTTPFALMTHSAGLEWWLPLYKKFHGSLEPSHRWGQMLKQLAKVKTKRRRQAVYSDLDLWLMGAYLEAVTGESLLAMWEDVHDRLGLKEIFFHPNNRPLYPRSSYAPTEECAWRGKVMQGEVHDENAWALGGVAPHAGLFGNIDAVSDWGLKLRRAWKGEFDGFGDSRWVRYFTARRLPREKGDWGLCFMKPSVPRASCGRYFSLKSFGHTGFTGTSLWYDPTKDILVVILSNRVHPTRENTRFSTELRPKIHELIVQSL